MARGGEVTAVVLTHAPGSGTLHACLWSLVRQSHPVDVFLVDNSVGADRAVVDDACRAFPGVRRTSPGRNLGFARGVNLALSRVTTPFVLILNDDSTLEPGATAAMRRSLDADAGTVAVAPKILLARHPHVLDGVGTVVRPDGLAFNRGIGQFDIGQYDEARPVFGVSFAACLIRRRAFEPDEVGPLDDTFFMYYEDVDWCYRAGLCGWRVATAPDAIAHHEGAHTARRRPAGFRHYFLYRNPLWLVVKNFEAPRAARALARRLAAVTAHVVRGPYRRAACRALHDFAGALPRHLAQRPVIQARRTVPDSVLLAHASAEVPCFDHDQSEPRVDLGTLSVMYERRYRALNAAQDRRIAELARTITATPDRRDLRRELLSLLSGQPEPVRGFAEPLLRS